MVNTVARVVDDSFDHWLAQAGEWVELPNERRGGTSGVQRFPGLDGNLLYRKYQVDHCYRDLKHPLGEPTVRREQRALLAFEALGVRVPRIVYCGVRRREGHWEALLVTEDLRGFESLESCFARGAYQHWGTAQREQIFSQLGQILARLHQQRWQHGCLYPKHIFLHISAEARVELALLDLEKTRQRWTVRQAACHDLEQLHRRMPCAPEDWQSLIHSYRGVMGWAPSLS